MEESSRFGLRCVKLKIPVRVPIGDPSHSAGCTNLEVEG